MRIFLKRILAGISVIGVVGGVMVDVLLARPTLWRSILLSFGILWFLWVLWHDPWPKPLLRKALGSRFRTIEHLTYLFCLLPFIYLRYHQIADVGINDTNAPDQIVQNTSGPNSPIVNQRDNNINVIGERQTVTINTTPQARRLLHEEREKFIDSLSSAQDGTVNVSCVLGDAEADQLSRDIVDTLKDAGWTIGEDHIVLPVAPTLGIYVLTGSDTPQAHALLDAFRAAGLEAKGVLFADRPGFALEIKVGSRKEP